MTLIVGLQHVQVSCPAGSEETLRRFYGQVLGMAELSKPPVLAARGGVWFRAGARGASPTRPAHSDADLTLLVLTARPGVDHG